MASAGLRQEARACGLRRRSRDQVDAIVLDHAAPASRPASAYDIAAATRTAGHPLAPNQVFRTLDRLTAQRRAYRVEVRAAYVLHSGAVVETCLVCSACRTVQRLADQRLTDRFVAEPARGPRRPGCPSQPVATTGVLLR